MISPPFQRMLRIQTTEGITFSQPIATPAIRMLALLIDYALIFLCVEAVQIPLTLLGLVSYDLAQAIALIALFVIGIGYAILLEWRQKGQTLGKRIMRIRVIHVRGLRLTFSQIVMRNLLRVIDQMPALYLVGGLSTLIGKRGQRLGDLIAQTVVVRIPHPRPPQWVNHETEKYNSLRERVTLVAHLRQEISPELADIARQACERRSQLGPKARRELFHELAEHIRQLVSFPREAVHGLSEERLVSNATELLFEAEKPSHSASSPKRPIPTDS